MLTAFQLPDKGQASNNGDITWARFKTQAQAEYRFHRWHSVLLALPSPAVHRNPLNRDFLLTQKLP